MAKSIYSIAFAFFVLSVFVWGALHIQKHMNLDIAYLTNSAAYLLAGERMSEAYRDTNPPLSIIVQIPSALMVKYTSIPIYYAVFIQAAALVAISSLFVFLLLKQVPWINKDEKFLLLYSYILSNTLMTGYDFGQKDQYVALFLFPLALLQILITYRKDVSPLLKWGVMVAGGSFILLKPHYGLIPAAIFLHRGIVQRRLSVIFDKDFICLGALFFLYLVVIFLFFDDYVTQALPDILMFYVSDVDSEALGRGVHYIFLVVIFIICCVFLFKKPQGFIIFLFLMSLLSIIPFIIQGKGFGYHIIPARVFFVSGLSIFIMHIMSSSLQYIFRRNYTYLALFGTLFIIYLVIYPFFTKPLVRMSHDDYRKSQLVKVLQQCSNSDAVFIYDDRSYTAQLLPIYSKKVHASRFQTFWFIPSFLKIEQDIKQGRNAVLSRDELYRTIKKYGDIIAQDINKYSPGIILISPVKYFDTIEGDFDLKDYFSEYSDEFKNIWVNYDLSKKLTIDRTPYFAKKNIYNIGTYYVYKHKKCKT